MNSMMNGWDRADCFKTGHFICFMDPSFPHLRAYKLRIRNQVWSSLWWTVTALSISNLKEKIVGFVICNSSALDLQLFCSTKNTPSFLSSSDHICECQCAVWGMCKFLPPPSFRAECVRWKPWAWPFHSLHKNANPRFRYFPTIGTLQNVSFGNYKMHWN